MAKKYLEGRIRYDENYMDDGEHYVFEIKWSSENNWGMEKAFRLVEDNRVTGDDKYVLIHYQALTQIREWMELGIKFHFE